MPVQSLPTRRYTEAEFLAARDAAPPGERWELVDGEALVTPGSHWLHQRTAIELMVSLRQYVQQQAIGETFISPLDLRLATALILQPDILVVPPATLSSRADIVNRALLAVEIISPSSARYDRFTKRLKYQQHRVTEYWIVDEQSRSIERWQPDDERPAVLDGTLVWQPAGASEPFTLDIQQFFRTVLPADEVSGDA